MSSDIITACISGLMTIIVTVIGVLGAKDRKKANKDREEAKDERREASEKAKIRAKESRLSMAMQNANCMLAVVTAKAVLHQHTNGDVEEAMNAAQTAETDYNEFLREISAEKITK